MIYRCLFFLLLGTIGGVAPVLAQGKKFRVIYSDAIFFRSGAAQVQPRYNKVLKATAAALKNTPDRKAWIQAHTDSLGSYDANLALSDQRALSVRHALVAMGVDSSQLRINSLGEYIPFRSNGTSDGRAYNRRVSIDVVEPFELPDIEQLQIKGRVIDAKTQKPLFNTRMVFNFLDQRDTTYTDSKGYYRYMLDRRTNIEVRAAHKGYFFVAKVAKFAEDTSLVNDTISFSLERAVLGQKMALNDLFFQRGTAVLLPASEKALIGLLSFMKYNNNLKIEIGGHINKPHQAPVPKSSSSFKLSENRAKVVYQYLIDQGVDPVRLRYQGYGNSEMIHPRASTPIQAQMNRRVELTIIGE